MGKKILGRQLHSCDQQRLEYSPTMGFQSAGRDNCYRPYPESPKDVLEILEIQSRHKHFSGAGMVAGRQHRCQYRQKKKQNRMRFGFNLERCKG